MTGRRSERQRRATAAVAGLAALALGLGTSAALAQIDPSEDPATVPTTQPATEPPVTGETSPPDVASTTDEEPVAATSPEASLDRQAAAPPPGQLSERDQQEAYAQACAAGAPRLPSSGMRAARQGTVGADGGSPLVVILGLLVAVAAFGYLWWRLRRGRGRLAQGSPLDVASAAVALVAGLAGLGAQFVPGLGARDSPPPAAAMEVRQVHARVTYGDFSAAVDGARRPATRVAREELGNVAWLELRLDGYGGERLVLDWAEYNVDTGGALIPKTAERRRLEVDSDHERRFEPVWVGYPRSGRFQVQFRLLDAGGEVRAMARTGPMRGTRYRYRCG